MASERIIDQKKAAVTSLAEELKSAETVVLAEYLGLTVAQDTDLRKSLREAGVIYKVVKNNIGRRAADEAGIEGLSDFFVGPTAIAYSDDVVAPAKVLYDFAKKNDIFTLKAGASSGALLSDEQLSKLSNMPSMDELRARLVGSLSSPISKLAMLTKALAEEVAGDVVDAEYTGASAEEVVEETTEEAPAESEETVEETTEEVEETTEEE